MFGEKTSPSAEYYARHVLGELRQCNMVKPIPLQTTIQNHVFKLNHVIAPGNMGNYWGNFGYPRYGVRGIFQKVKRNVSRGCKGFAEETKGF